MDPLSERHQSRVSVEYSKANAMVQSFRLEVHASLGLMFERGIRLWQEVSAAAIAERGYWTVALAGGSTPKQLYTALAKAPDIDWSRLWVYWGDERYVAPDHVDSNYRMARLALLDHVPLPPSQIFPWPTGSADPMLDVALYEKTLKTRFTGAWPDFDLVLLGIGDDGHTASLFPDTPALQVQDRWTTVGIRAGEPRLTLTFPSINHSRRVVFWVAGAGKAAILRQALTTPQSLPSQSIQAAGDLYWILDAPAASGLPVFIPDLS